MSIKIPPLAKYFSNQISCNKVNTVSSQVIHNKCSPTLMKLCRNVIPDDKCDRLKTVNMGNYLDSDFCGNNVFYHMCSESWQFIKLVNILLLWNKKVKFCLFQSNFALKLKLTYFLWKSKSSISKHNNSFANTLYYN